MQHSVAQKETNFKNSMTREQLDWHLSRSITMQPLSEESFCFYPPCNPPTIYDSKGYQDDLAMLVDIEARFIGRVAGLWEGEDRINRGFFETFGKTVDDIHRLYKAKGLPIPIIQASIFEAVSPEVNNITISDEVATAYGIKKRKFRYQDMLYASGEGVDNWRKGSSIPDMSSRETQMWFYFMATEFIKRGAEALHFGQVMIMNKQDPGNVHWWNLLSRIRSFAKNHNRGVVVCDAHTHGEYYKDTRQLLFDFHSAPIRPLEVEGSHRGEKNGGEVVIMPNVRDVIYGRSKGGKTYFGWDCESLPYLVEFDNNGVSDHPNEANIGWWVWGWDEITWFALQDPKYRRQWLRYAHLRVRELDTNGFLQMPGLKHLTRGKVYDIPWPDTFRAAHGTSESYYNLADTIKALWQVK
jgi:hypothetical protein